MSDPFVGLALLTVVVLLCAVFVGGWLLWLYGLDHRTLTTASPTFTSDDVGKRLVLDAEGEQEIVRVVSPHQVVLRRCRRA
jgi:hypothetical protein